MVARRDGPVEVVLSEDAQHGIVREKSDLLRVKCAEKVRRKVLVGCALTSDCQNKLHKTRDDVLLVPRLRLGPQYRLRLESKSKFRLRNIDAEVDVLDYARAVERAEPVGCDFVFQLLLAE